MSSTRRDRAAATSETVRRAGLVAAGIALAMAPLACTEDPLALGPGSAPGASTETRDVTLLVSDLATWRDTSLTGFALPNNANFSIVANRPDLSARTLGRFNVPDTIRTFADTLPVERFDSVTFRVQIDTIRSAIGGFPLSLRLFALNVPFEPDSVNWQQAGPGRPWAMPGGDLGVEVAAARMTGPADTVRLDLLVSGDSLLKAWQATDGENGLALVVEGPASRLRLQQLLLRYEALLVGRTVPVSQSQTAAPRTFISDPGGPPAGLPLRVGGLPASRFYVDFLVPSSVGGISVEGATINHAELIFRPLAAPAAPFALGEVLTGRQITLLGDPFTLGVKTPIGTSPLAPTALVPDSLAAGVPLRIDITLLVARAAADPARRIRIGLRGDPDAQSLGFWEFGSAEGPAATRPQLRIIFSPPPEFRVP